jgi:hypothetical protein
MPKQKRAKRQQTQFRDGVGPTPEWFEHNDCERIEAPRIEGHDHGNVRTVRRVNRAAKWERDGWITPEQRKSLDAWEALNASARLDHARSCLDMSPVGYGGGDTPAKVAMARRRLGEVNLALIGSPGTRITRSVWCWLTTDERIDYDLFGTRARDGKERVRSMVRAVADELAALMQ